MSVIEFWHWTPAWHWVLPVLALAVLAAFIGARLVLAEEARRLDGVEWDTDWHREPVTEDDADQIIAEWHDEPWNPPHSVDEVVARHMREIDEDRDFDWLVASLDQPGLSYEDRRRARLEYVAALAWDAKVAQGRCWEILHVEFPRLRAELAAA